MGQCWTRLRNCKGHHKRRQIGGKVQSISKEDIWEEKLTEARKNDKIVVVKFCAKWCKNCKEIATTYRELADKYPTLVFLSVDVDEMTEFSASFDIKATPTFYFLRSGQPMDKLVGANKVELRRKLATIAELSSRM
ncbi:thioredoxin H-type-like [Amaranthus tricolor]|uniref:thioredoxin H-type-like n=1 Tax=Amaranthus tricolor TaxID=29722 RepID=UPI0025851A34|nr:thioredoxin H-type-like [Amaranthus tricolor]